jgi:predicted CXXCH cytochrome family protein
MKRKKTRVVGRSVLLLCIGSGIFLVSCSSMFKYEPVVMTPLSIPGAEYLGPESCAAEDCHTAESRYFELTDHASVAIDITEEDAEAGQVEGCETCHGPGSLHVEDPTDKSKIIRANAETACFGCHLDVKGKFMLQHHHPVLEGRMTCSDCHDMHGKDVRATGGKMLLGAGLTGRNEKCFKCHKEQRGPFVFEHEAMREGCSVCHTPHGSINDKLLVAGQTITCVRCHIEPNETGNVHHGRTNCLDCHTEVHGSNMNTSLEAY